MNTDIIIRLLQNSGFHILGTDSTYLYLEDPSCILRSFETFIEYAWIVIVCITGVLLFGWAISMIRGAKNDIFTNLRNLIIMFGTLSAAVPIVNMIWGDDLFARGCRTIQVSFDELNKLLDARNMELGNNNKYNLYEEFNIYDSGVPTTPYASAPVSGAGTPMVPDVSVSSDGISAAINPVVPHAPAVATRDTATLQTPRDTRGTERPIRAHAASRDVIYTGSDGTQYRRTGGSRAWRNNNPGNIRYSEFSRRAGAIGEAGGFAVFPDEETGNRAISALLRTDSYNRLTVAGAISRYAPPTENNTSAYHRRIEQLTGLSINRRMSDLSDAELARVASAIRQIEGWTPGRTVAG